MAIESVEQRNEAFIPDGGGLLLAGQNKVVTGMSRIKKLAVHTEVIVNKKISLFLLLALLAFGVSQVAADAQPLSLASGYEQALNLGDLDAATALFADDASFAGYIGGETIAGRAAIQDALSAWTGANRTFDVVGANMADNVITLTVDIADYGITWGRQTLRMVIEDGLIQSLEPVAFRFLF